MNTYKYLIFLIIISLNIPILSQPGRQNYIGGIYFLSSQIGWINIENRTYKTTNGGISWSVSHLGWYPYIHFVSEKVGYISASISQYSSDRILLKTTDQGISWQNIYQENNKIRQFYFIDEKLGYGLNYIEYNGTDLAYLVRTINGGVTWDSLLISGIYTAGMWVNDFNEVTVYGGESVTEDYGFITKTTNGGLNWNYNLQTNHRIYGMCYIDSLRGFASSLGLFRTSNGGKEWKEDSAGVGYWIYFVDKLTGYSGILTSTNPPYSSLYRTTNAGETWVSLEDHTLDSLRNYYFVDSLIGYVGGYGNYFAKTTDGGYTWNQYPFNIITSQEEDNVLISFILEQNYPNPFNPSTKIYFAIPKQSLVSIKVYDILGKEITQLVNEVKQPGRYEVEFDGSSLSSGIYFYQIQSENYLMTKKMILMK
ncbi:MAG TPA: T9SS type A sorting domain-containing protein [Ignavibacteriaceae bacterium]|nr:T9SS type A sorting domain-containing protein [Ignavibacteriaceae bacterium]